MLIAILLPFYFVFGCYTHTTRGTAQQATESLWIVFLFILWFTSPFQYNLYLIEKALGNNGLVFTLVHFFAVPKMAVVKRIGKNKGNAV
ncbi:MAG: hypothetical protein A3C15_01990 [Candidatus Magasanikbacteria bacterium RIFCSPHIGHO2_02_FULL_50_9b]|uniref:Uncharacterized protein n=1 Tax=Candidatus Magasanikbacteria bacterium RIFCSPHIGHO2_02_FULL_50_9b TaxID=1798682 RepID=A0A1F6M913_9BACT|nr:MAG: hypothetical protein A3C15_01990 [Candidatus Magasanikbacteria bacterium RIFCSPHIGHO2_02_FULL_50_9b]